MKAVFTTNHDHNSYSSHRLLKVAITSLKLNTTLEPVVIWDGQQDKTTGWLEDNNVPVIYHTLSFKDKITHFEFRKNMCQNHMIDRMYRYYPYYNKTFIITESMRLDIPDLFPEDEYVLYCDCDVMFLKEPTISTFKSPLGASVRDGEFFNNGVMVFNLPEYRKFHEKFKQFYIDSNYVFEIGNTTTQGAYNTFFKNNVHDIGLDNNWHSFWGVNLEARIIHWCGPKPFEYEEMKKEFLRHSDPTLIEHKYEFMYYNCLTYSMDKDNSMEYYLNEWRKYESLVPIS